MLIQSGLVYKVYHSDSRGVLLGAQIDTRKFKLMVFDTGIHQRLGQLDLSDYILSRDFNLINKGHLAEVFAGLELIRNQAPTGIPQLYYWHRENRGSNAELDYVINKHEQILPIEVKAGTKGQMQSMYIFLNDRSLPQGIRISAEPFGANDKIKVLPLYAIRKLYD